MGPDPKRTIISRFGRLRAKQDWWSCRDLATELLMLDLPTDERAEALFALGYAQEKLGNEREAIVAYRRSLRADAEHQKSVRSLARLVRTAA
jgi:tetratricopeptide (TPR) repeat protein